MKEKLIPTENEISYLKKLKRDIYYDESLKVDLENDNVGNVRDALQFFKDINLELNDVEDINCRFVKVEDLETIIDPSYSKSRLVRRIFAGDQHISRIVLGNNDKDVVRGSYIHEVVHTQVHKYGYIPQVENDYNIEVLPMFIELLYANINNLDKIKLRRIASLNEYIIDYLLYHEESEDVTKDIKDKSERNIKSFLQATHLLKIYNEMDNEKKNELIDDISNVFNSYSTVEELLKKYNVKYENSAYDLKTLKRSL